MNKKLCKIKRLIRKNLMICETTLIVLKKLICFMTIFHYFLINYYEI